jgi:hypothetical protein
MVTEVELFESTETKALGMLIKEGEFLILHFILILV